VEVSPLVQCEHRTLQFFTRELLLESRYHASSKSPEFWVAIFDRREVPTDTGTFAEF